MLDDRRRSRRVSVGTVALIPSAANSAAHQCILSDLSEDGVRLAGISAEVPQEFVLQLDEQTSRSCRVVWQLDDELGAEFTDTADEGWLRTALERVGRSAA